MLSEGTRLSHYAKSNDSLVTTAAANTTGLGITLWQQPYDGNTNR